MLPEESLALTVRPSVCGVAVLHPLRRYLMVNRWDRKAVALVEKTVR